ncbi:hypothetical protein PR048_031970 [Dryococelus australis]|uniref:Uncharacterized protein n=1 Tax=Dryococelus australis TaxID=614101 RepID=A0ABQ9G6T1_9NEOP|nr:hypothetical protein PR048_031970 [Dryococelus australis]
MEESMKHLHKIPNNNNMIQYLRSKHNNELDETDNLMLGYTKTIQKFTPRRQAVTKMKIAQLIMQQELKMKLTEAVNRVLPHHQYKGIGVII